LGSHKQLAAGLYLVSTPIGSARDITLRALDVLGAADVLLAEDTRVLRKLFEIHGLQVGDRRLIAYHDHNGRAKRPEILRHLDEGASVALTSDAGTPIIADPGYGLIQAVQEAGHAVVPVPGASAVLPALQLAALPTDRFMFAGFPPNASGARKRFFEELKAVPATLAIYESPKRVSACLADLLEIMGNRDAALCREITKKFEEVRHGKVSELIASVETHPPKGEIVLVIGQAIEAADAASVEEDLVQAMKTHSVKDAASLVAEAHGVPRREVYQLALLLGKRKSD